MTRVVNPVFEGIHVPSLLDTRILEILTEHQKHAPEILEDLRNEGLSFFERVRLFFRPIYLRLADLEESGYILSREGPYPHSALPRRIYQLRDARMIGAIKACQATIASARIIGDARVQEAKERFKKSLDDFKKGL